MAARLRVGLAGLGTMGGNHLRNLLSRDDVTLVGFADPSPDAIARASEKAGDGVHAYSRPNDLIESEQLDALIVAVPTTLHYQVASIAIARGISVLVEKPIAASVVEARELVHAAKARGVLLQPGHIERFNPAIVELGRRLNEGALTRILSVKTVRAGPLPDRIRDVGVAIDLATHDIDIMCHLLQERPTRVYAERSRQVHTAHEDLLYGLLSFPSGVVGQLDVNWLTPDKQRRVVVLGLEGRFDVDYLEQSLSFTRGASVLSPEYLDGYAATFAGDTVTLPVEKGEPLRLELDAFFDAIRTDGEPVVSPEDGLMALLLAKLLLSASDEGRSLFVPHGDGTE